ncbi:MAG TPA: MFS transporter [Solimonas sp.]|nr:MFS transporter [Solimonas sp.]
MSNSLQTPAAIPAAGRPDASLRQQPLSAGLRLAYSLGAAPDAMINIALNVFLLYYLTSICGLSPALAGFAVAAGLVIDALLDPWIGMRSDHCRSRLGRRLPFMLGAIPLALGAFVLLFTLPRIEQQPLLFGIVMMLCISIRIGLSTFALPYLAVGAEISDDDTERARIITWRWGAAVTLSLVTVLLGFGLFFKGEGGIARPEGYPAFALALAGLVSLMAAAAMYSVWRTLGRQHPPPPREAGTLGELLREIGQLFRSSTFRIIFTACLLSSAAQSVTQSLSLHAYTFFWKLGGEQVQVAIISLTVGLILGAPIGGLLIKRWEHRKTIVLAVFGMMLAQAAPPALRLCGLLPLEGNALGLALAGAQLLAGMTMTSAMMALMAMTTDALDEHEYHYGVRVEGFYFAGWTLAAKAANGLGALLSGVALQLIDFPTKAVSAGAVAEIPERTTQLLGLAYGPGAAVLTAATLVVLAGYPLSREKHRSIMKELQERKSHDREPSLDMNLPAETPL